MLIDYEGPLVKTDLTLVYLWTDPFRTARHLGKSIFTFPDQHKLVRSFRSSYEGELVRDRERFDRVCNYISRNCFRDGIPRLFSTLESLGCEYRLLSTTRHEIVLRTLELFSSGLIDERLIVASTKQRFMGAREKAEVARKLKQKGYELIAVDDSLMGRELLSVADTPILIRTLAYYLSGRKPTGYEINDLYQLIELIQRLFR